MKRTILIALLVALWLPTFAQQEVQDFYRHEVTLGYGFHPVSGDEFFFSGYHFGHDVDQTGAFYGAYTYYFNQYFGVGGTYCFDPRIINYWYNSYSTSTNTEVCALNESCHSLMGHVKYNCINKKYFTLYLKCDAGLCFWDYKLTEYHPELFEVELPTKHCCFAWETAAGVEAGYGPVAAFLQFGIGMEGNYSLGIRYKFKNGTK